MTGFLPDFAAGNRHSASLPLFKHCEQGIWRSHFSFECRQWTQLSWARFLFAGVLCCLLIEPDWWFALTSDDDVSEAGVNKLEEPSILVNLRPFICDRLIG